MSFTFTCLTTSTTSSTTLALAPQPRTGLVGGVAEQVISTLRSINSPSSLCTPASRRLSSIPRRYKIRSPLFAKMDFSRYYDSVFAIRLFFGYIYIWCGFLSQKPSGRTRRRPMSMFLDHERLVDYTIRESVQIVIPMITVPPRCTRRTRVVTSRRRTILPSRGR